MPAQPTAASPTGHLLRNPALGRAAAALAVYEGLTQVVSRGQQLWRERLAYTVTVTERDPIYADVHDWLLSIMPTDRHRSLVVRSSRDRTDDSATPASDGPTDPAVSVPLKVMFNDQRPRRVLIDGHSMTVTLEKPSIDASSVRDREMAPEKIMFTGRTHAAQQAVVAHLRRIHAARREDRKPVLRMVTQWGSWRARSDLPPRSLASVAMPADQRVRIVADLREFLDAEDRYNRLAIPWHRGYMFHGPPGTGKTSLVRALASEFNLDLWYVSLSDLTAEASLMGLLSEVGPRSMLLLEDIDTIQISHARNTQQGKISMSSLLNALDGVATPHGLISVMTTNHFERLDPALTRAGRMDVVEELGFATQQTVSDLFEHFYGTRLRLRVTGRTLPVSTAEVSEVFKRHLDDPAAARCALIAHLDRQPVHAPGEGAS